MNNSIDVTKNCFFVRPLEFQRFLRFFRKHKQNKSIFNTSIDDKTDFVEIHYQLERLFLQKSQSYYFKNARTRTEFICFFNNSSHVTEHFLHTSSEITTFLTNVFENMRKHNDFVTNLNIHSFLQRFS